MTLPHDMARCENDECPLRNKCLRYLDPGREGYQSFTDFPGGEDCDWFIPVADHEKQKER